LKVLVITEKFPNIIQPWLANSVAQIIKHGGDVQIISQRNGDEEYACVVDDYSLKDKVIFVRIWGGWLALSALRSIFRLWSVRRIRKVYGAIKNPGRSFPSAFRKLLNILALSSLYELRDIGVIHSHFERSGYKLLPVVKSLDVPFVVTFHGLEPPGVLGLPNELRKEYLDASDLILLNTEFAKALYMKLGAKKKKIYIIPQGTDTQMFTYRERDLPDERPLKLLSVGRLSADKGHEYTIRAVKELVDLGEDVQLTIIGQGPDKDDLMGFIDSLLLSGRINIRTGLSESELIERYHEADIFVLSSISSEGGWHEETQGVVLQEAQATGALVIATRVGGIPECIVDGENGFLIEEKNSLAITEKIQWLLSHKTEWERWRKNARKHVEEKYDIDVIGRKMYHIYEHLADRQSA